MNVIFDGATLEVTTRFIGLGLIVPVLNGQLIQGAIWREVDGRRTETTSAPMSGGTFYLDIVEGGETSRAIQYGVEGLPDDFILDSFGIAFTGLTNLRAFLRMGYYSWDGASYIEPETAPSDTVLQGCAMTQLLSRSAGSVIVGFDHHDRFQHSFRMIGGGAPHVLTIETLWDRKDHSEGCLSERLILFEHEGDHEEGLRRWARIVAETMNARASEPITGWCSWYNLYAAITEENILEHLRGTTEVSRRDSVNMRVFQIDDGFTPEMGDWLDVKPQFPRGMKLLLDDIRAAGFTPGLWIAPFMVGNRSKLYRDHPDWVVKYRDTDKPIAPMTFYGEFRWHKRSEEYYILDTTHPDAFEYLRRVFHTWRYEWGCEYFKTDFMHFGSEYGADVAQWHTTDMSRMEIWRRTAAMIRETIGDAIWLGCGCPLWASVGLVDAIRIGRDVGVEWRGDYSAQSMLRDGMMRNFGSGILWQADPDCILLREQFHKLSDTEVRSLAIYAGMAGKVIMTSDHLGELSPERLRLWNLLVKGAKGGACRYPLMGQSTLLYGTDARGRSEGRAVDPVIVQVRPSETLTAVFLLNGGETSVDRVYPLDKLGLKPSQYTYDWTADRASQRPVDRLVVTLSPHDGALIFLSDTPIQTRPDHLP